MRDETKNVIYADTPHGNLELAYSRTVFRAKPDFSCSEGILYTLAEN